MMSRRDVRYDLLVAGARLVRFERRDLNELAANVTLTAVAAEAGVSRNTLRRYFANKAEYVDALLEHLLVHFLEIDYVLGDEVDADDGTRVFTLPAVDFDDVDLADLAGHFAKQEMDHWAPPGDEETYAPFDWNVLWLHSLIYLRDHPGVAKRLSDCDSIGFESLATELYEPMLTAIGRRPIPPLDCRDIAEMVAAMLDGYGIRLIVNPAAARRSIEFEGRRWEGATLAAFAIVDRLTEPIPTP